MIILHDHEHPCKYISDKPFQQNLFPAHSTNYQRHPCWTTPSRLTISTLLNSWSRHSVSATHSATTTLSFTSLQAQPSKFVEYINTQQNELVHSSNDHQLRASLTRPHYCVHICNLGLHISLRGHISPSSFPRPQQESTTFLGAQTSLSLNHYSSQHTDHSPHNRIHI